MNWKEIMGNGIVVPGAGGIKRQSSRASIPMLCGMHRRASYLAMYFLCIPWSLTPAPAAMIAVILMLKALCQYPAPTISTTESSSWSTDAGIALDLNKFVVTANDSGHLSRQEMWSALRNAPIYVGLTVPAMKTCSTASCKSCGWSTPVSLLA